MQCKDCRFADWETTKTGRLSPTGKGRCTWSKIIRVPPQNRYPDGEMMLRMTETIWRNEPRNKCPVGQRK